MLCPCLDITDAFAFYEVIAQLRLCGGNVLVEDIRIDVSQ